MSDHDTNPLQMTDDRLRSLLNESPYCRFLGAELFPPELPDSILAMRFAYRSEFGRLGLEPQWHGGVLASVLDTVANFAMMRASGEVCATVNLRVDYLRPASGAWLRAEAKAVRVGRRFGVIDAEAFNADGKPVAAGRGIFVPVPESPPPAS